MSKENNYLNENPLQYMLNSYIRGADKNIKPIYECHRPTNSITIDKFGNCFPCICEGWLPYSIGNVLDFFTLDEVFQSQTAKMIQKDVADKNFTWCAVDKCDINYSSILHKGYEIWFTIDPSCNLFCPSCRKEKIMHTTGPGYDNSVKILQRVKLWLEQFDKPVILNMSGDGDPLASLIFRTFIKEYRPTPKQKIRLSTNGLLMKKILPETHLLDQISIFSISVDAASKLVYENVRRPGKWENILENLDWLKSYANQKTSKPKIIFNFTIQKNNFRDILKFAELAAHYGSIATFGELNNWNTWNVEFDDSVWTKENGIFLDHNVLDHTHPDFIECMLLLHQVADHPNVKFAGQTKKIFNSSRDKIHPYLIKQTMAEKVGFEPTEDLHPR